jgi:predicted cytidylate kinase
VTLSGLAGSGKTTVAKLLSKELGLRMVSASVVFRERAEKMNRSLEEFGKYVAAHPEIDDEIDERQIALAREGDAVLEGRLSGWMTYRKNIDAFRVWLSAPFETRVRRIMSREQRSYEDVAHETKEREACEIERYKKHYSIDLQDTSIYDLIIDTQEYNQYKVAEIIIEHVGAQP